MSPVTVGSASVVGPIRKVNEDSLYVGQNIWVVADGMGGHAAGDTASAMAIAKFAALDEAGRILSSDIADATTAANREIWQYGLTNRQARGLGTTVTGVARTHQNGQPCWVVFNVGDSRVYHILDGRLTRLTIDHSEVEALVMAGVITTEEARVHPGRNVVTRSLGVPGPVTADLWVLPAAPPEGFLICSDGLYTELTDDEILACLQGTLSPEAAVDSLVSAAVEAGGHDNVTVIVLAVGD